MELYKIKNWNEQFENNRTRQMKNMMWIPVPNKQDGDGYTELVDHEHGAAHLGAWLVILQVASKCAERGTLMRDNGTPHTPASIARVSRVCKGIIGEAITRLCSKEIAWLEVVENKEVATKAQEGARPTHPTDEEEKGREGNRREEKGREEDPPPPVSEQFNALQSGEVKDALRMYMNYKKERKDLFTPISFNLFVATMRREYESLGADAFVRDVEECLNKGWKNLVFPSRR